MKLKHFVFCAKQVLLAVFGVSVLYLAGIGIDYLIRHDYLLEIVFYVLVGIAGWFVGALILCAILELRKKQPVKRILKSIIAAIRKMLRVEAERNAYIEANELKRRNFKG